MTHSFAPQNAGALSPVRISKTVLTHREIWISSSEGHVGEPAALTGDQRRRFDLLSICLPSRHCLHRARRRMRRISFWNAIYHSGECFAEKRHSEWAAEREGPDQAITPTMRMTKPNRDSSAAVRVVMTEMND